MTRRRESGRVTQPAEQGAPAEPRYPSLRERSPVAYWVAIIGVVSMVLGLVATTLAALL